MHRATDEWKLATKDSLAYWRHMVFINIINDLSPACPQAIAWLFVYKALKNILHRHFSSYTMFFIIKENIFQNTLCEMAAILFKPHFAQASIC